MKIPIKKLGKRFLVPLIGLGTLVWFLVRVIPKPSRAAYPCMQAAAPVASAFVLSVVGFFGSLLFFKKARSFLYEKRLVLFGLALVAAVGLGGMSLVNQAQNLDATVLTTLGQDVNKPVGTGVGVNPGRVVWVHDADATDETCMNRSGDLWFDDSNTNQAVVSTMFARGLRELTSSDTLPAAWDALFKNFNSTHNRGTAGYTKGEKIVIKINLNGMGNGKQNIDTSPQICWTILDNLVNVVGVNPEDITLGDPNINLDSKMFAACFKDFPKVKYWGSGNKLTRPRGTGKNVFFASDKRESNELPQAYVDATYMFNIPVLKKHHRGGISLAAKNHFGSFTPYNSNGAFKWHYSLPVPDGSASNSNGKYGSYRCFVDIIGHKDLGGKTILYLIDGLWGSYNWGHPAVKWRMAPFNNDWPNSLLLSQDPVAVESVGFDFLFAEFDPGHPTEGYYDARDDHGPFPRYVGVDDYLHQAASSANWPKTIVYDPERDNSPLPSSMGVHEHWNNPTDKKYSRNLGTGLGIDLDLVEAPSKEAK